jgi:proteasome lid subunit RPN8/RPN11
MLEISAGLLAQIRAHAGETYPHECCGILLGTCESGLRKVRELRRAKNINTERSQDRYLMDPQDQLAAEKHARAQELEVIGYYHSHPDHPAQASATDSAQSWENVSYLIVSVKNGSPAAEASFSRDASQNLLQPEEWVVSA